MREIRTSSLEGGVAQPNAPSLPLSAGGAPAFSRLCAYDEAKALVILPSVFPVSAVSPFRFPLISDIHLFPSCKSGIYRFI